MNVKFIASGFGFASLGALVAWSITADRAEQKAQRMAEEFSAMSDALREKNRENINLRYELNDKCEEIENLQGAIDVETGFSEIENSPGENSVEINSGGAIEEVHIEPDNQTDEEIELNRERLRQLVSGYIPSSDEVEIEEERVVVKSTKYDPPFVISESEFMMSDDEGNDYAKSTLLYYTRQQVLLDEEEEPVDDIEMYVGWRNLRRFGDQSSNPDAVYVRNRRMEADFEVERVTDEDLPLHVQYAMPKIEFDSKRAAGKLRLQDE